MDRIVLARVRAQRWYVRYPRAVPLAIFLAVLTVAALGIYGMERIEGDRARSQVRVAAGDVGAALESRAMAHVTYLRAEALLLSASPRNDRKGFRQLAASMVDDNGFRSGLGITWAPRVAVGDVPAFELARRAEGLTRYTVHPMPTAARNFVVPVTYASNAGPANDDSWAGSAIGFDITSDPQRRAAISRAARTRRPFATGKLALLYRTEGDRSGFLIYMPVYARRSPVKPGLPSGGELRGFVCAPFDAQAFLDAALTTVPVKGLDVRLYDGRAIPDRLLARAGANPDPGKSYTRRLDISGRSLLLVVGGPGKGKLSNLSVLTLVFALLVGALLTQLTHVVTRNAQDDLTALDWMEEQIVIRNTLTRELNHRVKNTLANVLSIIALTRRRAAGLDEFADSLAGRVMALSATHDLLTGLSWEPAPLRDIIAAELAPYTGGGDHTISIAGPDVALAPSDALSLGLAVHELATNASKYGALSVVAGQVSVSWEMMTPDLLRIVWVEQGGPLVPPQRRRGFGTDLIEKIVANELGHSVDLSFDRAGVRCTLVVPVRAPVAFQIRAAEPPSRQ